MPATYDSLATTTLSSNQASVTFSSISSNYTDLVLIMSVKSSNAVRGYNIQYNGDTAGNYSETQVYADGIGTTYSFRTSNDTKINVSQMAASSTNEYVIGVVNIMNYSNTTTNKTLLTRWGQTSTDGGIVFKVGNWRSNNAITSIYLYPNGDNFASGSTFSLYGIKAA